MEFACGFVYAAPSTQKQNRNSVKISALLPPRHKIFPSSPLPPPPTASEETQNYQSSFPEKRLVEDVTKNNDPKRAWNKEPLYENTEFHQKQKTIVQSFELNPGVQCPPQPMQGEKRKALLPPPRKLQLGSSSLSSGLDSISDSNASQESSLVYDCPDPEKDDVTDPLEATFSYSRAEAIFLGQNPDEPHTEICRFTAISADLPPLPPRPSFMKRIPQYQVFPNITLSSDSPPSSTCVTLASDVPLGVPADKQPLPGDPNVILVNLGKIVTEDNASVIEKELATCTRCLSASESIYDNLVESCYFCQPWKSSTSPSSFQPVPPPTGCQDYLCPLSPEPEAKSPRNSLVMFCIDISEAMTGASEMLLLMCCLCCPLQHVQQAVLQCVQTLGERDPSTRVGLITFNDQVALHGRGPLCSQFLLGKELDDRDHVQKVAAGFRPPPPLSESREWLRREIHSLSLLARFSPSPLRLQKCGKVAMGPAVLVAITMASQQPGSKVVICTGSKANTALGNLEVEDTDSHSLVASSIFYQELAEHAAHHGVMLSVVTFEQTDCRLDELGKLADRTGGKVAIVRPSELCGEFLLAAERTAVATHCSVTLLLPTALCTRGEKEAGNRITRDVGNVTPDTEITFRFRAREEDAVALLSAGEVRVQLQIQYRRAGGRAMFRVLSVSRRVTDDIALALSSMSLPILQLNLSHSCSALALRGRYRDAQREGETQTKLMERALDFRKTSEGEQKRSEWEDIVGPPCDVLHRYMRTKPSSMSDIQSLTDTGAMLLFAMKNGSRMSLLQRGRAELPS
ncbi:circularly permutated Ras protein 1-like [Arapaima gigas]